MIVNNSHQVLDIKLRLINTELGIQFIYTSIIGTISPSKKEENNLFKNNLCHASFLSPGHFGHF